MVYVSMLVLDPRCRQVQAELRDPYQMHRTLSKAFGDDKCVYKDARCLFRVDESDDGRRLYALVQSKVQPDWERWHVPRDYLAEEPRVKEFEPLISAGQRLGFRLRANPTVKRDGKRIGICDETERLAWLNRKAERSGFKVLSTVVSSDGKLKGSGSDGQTTTFIAAVFNGALEVVDSSLFLDALEKGVGSAKGFGFGLLSVAPLRR